MHNCKDAITHLIESDGPQHIGTLRNVCMLLAEDYSVENVNAAVNDLMYDGIISNKAKDNLYSLGCRKTKHAKKEKKEFQATH